MAENEGAKPRDSAKVVRVWTGSPKAAGTSSSSSLFHHNRDITKSSRSIRHDLESPVHEAQPLLGGSAPSHPRSSWESRDEDQRLVRIAAAFLNDYEAGQAPTLPPDLVNIADLHLHLHAIRFSKVWRVIMVFATGCLFVGSCFEGSDEDEAWETYDRAYLAERIRRKQKILSFCTFIPVVIIALDVSMMAVLFSRRGHTERLDTLLGADSTENTARHKKARTSRSFWWAMPVMLFLVVFSVETMVVIQSGNIMRRRIWSSLAKPIVLFYLSSRTRNALDALNRVIRVVLKVILIELFLIFTFGSVANQLFGDEFEAFEGLPVSFLSMFQLSTTVVNPSLWMPVVAKYGRSSSVFFIMFLVTR